jgi:tetratricopeptide (TPR) repeat protein
MLADILFNVGAMQKRFNNNNKSDWQMKIKIVAFIFLLAMSCQHKKTVNSKAAALFKKASEVFKNNPANNDSLIHAINLLDSSIHLDETQPNFYFTKYQISMLLKRYDLAINSSNRILAIDKNNFLALFGKSVAFELLNNVDSAMYGYKQALGSLESTKFSSSLYKESERIILYGLLKDTINFNLKLKQFKERFNADKEFPILYKDLIQFNRDDYIKSF